MSLIRTINKLRGYRTLAFNGIVGVLAIVKAVRPSTPVPSDQELQILLDTLLSGLDYVAVIGNILLRFDTRTAIFKAK